MAKKTKFCKGTKEAMEILLRKKLSGPEVRRVQSVFLGAQGVSSLVISTIVGHTPEHVRKTWTKYRASGEDALLGENRGNGRGKAHLTMAEEKEFLQPFIEKAKKAGILIVSEVHEELRKKLKKEKLHHSVTYNLLHRHGWRKIVPRPSHPKADPEARKAFQDSFPPRGKKGIGGGTKKKSSSSSRISR